MSALGMRCLQCKRAKVDCVWPAPHVTCWESTSPLLKGACVKCSDRKVKCELDTTGRTTFAKIVAAAKRKQGWYTILSAAQQKQLEALDPQLAQEFITLAWKALTGEPVTSSSSVGGPSARKADQPMPPGEANSEEENSDPEDGEGPLAVGDKRGGTQGDAKGSVSEVKVKNRQEEDNRQSFGEEG